jgi:hypothetical protein
MHRRGHLLAGLVAGCAYIGASACASIAGGSNGGVADAYSDGTTDNGAIDGSTSGDADAMAGGGGIGSACTPVAESSPSFLGFGFREVSTESNAPDCRGRVCLVNHFQGRVSCPYGQQADGSPVPGTASCTPSGNNGCCSPRTNLPITGQVNGTFVDPTTKATVTPQCVDRTASEAVYCTCQCAIGMTVESNYCSCPSGFICTQLYASIGGDDPRAGAYCVKDGTQYDAGFACNSTCDPSLKNCGDVQGVH